MITMLKAYLITEVCRNAEAIPTWLGWTIVGILGVQAQVQRPDSCGFPSGWWDLQKDIQSLRALFSSSVTWK